MKQEQRFEFGKNWKSFIKDLDNEKVENSTKSLLNFLELDSLEGKSFLDIGCGSGLSSLAAKKSGANVSSFDYDNYSVEATHYLKNKFYPDDINWSVSQGSALDPEFLKNIGKYDFVYSWGVLHHTGNMIQALENIDVTLKKSGILFISIYNDQGIKSKIWKVFKRLYVKYFLIRPLFILYGYFFFGMPQLIKPILSLIGFDFHKKYKKKRGMSFHHDIVDWMGGYPFEVATPDVIIDFYISKGYILKKLKSCGGKLGCNEFLFQKQ